VCFVLYNQVATHALDAEKNVILTDPMIRALTARDEEYLVRGPEDGDCATDGARSDGIFSSHFRYY
jgi:hypothetical protein